MKKLFAIFFFLAISVQPTYADLCRSENGKVTIDGTPQPSLVNCPMEMTVNSHTSTTQVHMSTNSQPTQPPTIVTVVVTASPTPTVMPTIIYKVIYQTATPTPTLEPTATPSATPTKA